MAFRFSSVFRGNERHTLHWLFSISIIVSLAIAAWFAGSARASGSVLYVQPAGATTGACGSWVHACDLQYALGIAVSGQELWVKQGIYRPTATMDRTVSFVLKNGVALYGGFAGTETLRGQRNPAVFVSTLSGDIGTLGDPSDNSYHVVVGSGTDRTAILDGFSVSDGNAGNTNNLSQQDIGGGMYNRTGSPTVANVLFTNNLAFDGGGGMDNSVNSSPLLKNVTFINNSSLDGGAIYNAASSPVLKNVRISGNTSTGSFGGGGIFDDGSSNPALNGVTFDGNSSSGFRGGALVNQDGASPTLVNVTFNGNSGGSGAAVYNTFGSPKFTNVTFSGNTSSTAQGVMFNDQSAVVTIRDSIFWSDTGGEVVNSSTGTSSISDSTVGGGCPASGSTCSNIILADPLLGPLGFNGGPTATMPLGPGSPAIDTGNDSTCAKTDQRGVTRPQGSHCDMGAYEQLFYPVMYAQPVGLTTGWCDTWANACRLAYALQVARLGQQIWAKSGPYWPTNTTDRTLSFNLKNGVAVYGGFVGTETQLKQRNPIAHQTLLSGNIGSLLSVTDNSYHVVNASGTDHTAVLDGVFIVDGYADSASYPDNDGAGLFNNGGSPTLRNVLFGGNQSFAFGGGMYNNAGSPSLTNVTFWQNSASLGGAGMYSNGGHPVLVNATFTANTAGAFGGGMENDSSNATLKNVTFSGNSAPSGGGAIDNVSSNPHIFNSIFWGDGTEFDNVSSAPVINYSIVQGGCPLGASCSHVLNSDPLLGALVSAEAPIATMPLQWRSPAIDAGQNSTCTPKDERGVVRPQDGNGDGTAVCDLGATESRYLTTTLRSIGADDGWVLESGQNTGSGGSMNSSASTFNLGDDSANRQYRSILSFNTGGLPVTAVVRRATLSIQSAGLAGSNPFSTLGNIVVDMDNGAFNGNVALELADFQAGATKSAAFTITNNPVNGWYSKALGSANLSNINLTGVTQFRLRFAKDDNNNSTADFIQFYSGNAAVASRPTLALTYYLP